MIAKRSSIILVLGDALLRSHWVLFADLFLSHFLPYLDGLWTPLPSFVMIIRPVLSLHLFTQILLRLAFPWNQGEVYRKKVDITYGNGAHFLKKWANPGLFFIYFHFSNTHYKFYNKQVCEKCVSSIRCWDSNSRPLEHESPPITTT